MDNKSGYIRIYFHLTKFVDGVKELAYVLAYIAAVFHALEGLQ